MLRITRSFVLLCVFVIFTQDIYCLFSTELVDDFKKTDKYYFVNSDQHDLKLTTNNTGKARLVWNNTLLPRTEMHCRWTGKRANIMPDDQGVYRLTLNSTPADGLKVISLRLQDADNEFFQYATTNIQKNTDGSVSYFYQIKDQSWKANWGKNNNKKVDSSLSFYGLAMSFDAKIPTITVDFQQLDFIRPNNTLNAIHLDIDTGNNIYYLRPGEEDNFRVILDNRSGLDLSVQTVIQFEDFFGRVLSETHALDFAAGEIKRLVSENPLPAQGYWQVSATISHESGEIVKNTAFIYAEPATVTPMLDKGEFLFGINSHLLRWDLDEYQRGLDFLVAGGAKLLRASVWWDKIEKQPDIWDFSLSDRISNDLEQRGIAWNWCLNPVPRWAAPAAVRDQGYWVYSRTAPEEGLYNRFAAKIAERYQGKVMFWELWNEADLNQHFTIDSYLSMLKEGYTGIKQHDQFGLVTTTGFASLVHPKIIKNFQTDVLTRGKGYYDVHAIHEHGDFGSFTSVIDGKFIPVRQKLGITEPWFANETAVTSVGGQERMQALTVFKKILFAWARGSISYVWYNLRNTGNNPMDAEHTYGLLLNDFHPKPGFAVFSALTKIYSGLQFDKSLESQGQYVFCFKNPPSSQNCRVIAAWRQSGDALYCVKTNASQAEYIDIMGNRQEIPIQNEMVAFAVGEIPGSLYLHDATTVELGQKLVSYAMECPVIPGQDGKLLLQVQNPFDQSVAVKFALVTPGNIKFKQQFADFDLAAKSQIVWKLDFNADSTFTSSQAGLNFTWGEQCGYLAVQLPAAKLIKSENIEGRQPDFVIDSIKNVHSQYKADPQSQYRLWKDKTDQSAQIWLGQEDDCLRIRIAVVDDIHCQPYDGSDVFLGDNVQLAFLFENQSGFWEIGLSRLDSGESATWVWVYPTGFDARVVAKAIELFTSREDNITVYEAKLPYSALGLVKNSNNSTFRFNLIINENDGDGRDGWLFLAPGLGTVKNPERFPLIVFDK